MKTRKMKRKDTWIEVEKESEVDEHGQWIDKKKKYVKLRGLNPKLKDSVDLLFRLLTGAAIFIPLLLLFLQNKRDSERLQKEKLSQLYTEIIMDFQILMTAPNPSQKYNDAKERLITNYSPRLALYGDNNVLKKFDVSTYLLIVKGNEELIYDEINTMVGMENKLFALADELGISLPDRSINWDAFIKNSRAIIARFDSIVVHSNKLMEQALETGGLINKLINIDTLRTPLYNKVSEQNSQIATVAYLYRSHVNYLRKKDVDATIKKMQTEMLSSSEWGYVYNYRNMKTEVDSIFSESKNEFELLMISKIKK